MRKCFLLIISLLSIGFSRAQVGINTLYPQGIFHLDAKGDTGSTGTNFSDDVVVTAKGNVGIGTLSPSTKLQVNTSDGKPFIRIQDPSEEVSDGKYLVSDENGAGSWVPKAQLSGKVYRMTSPSQKVITCKAGEESAVLFNKIKEDDGSLIENTDGGYIKINADGNYIFTLRWFGSVGSPLVLVPNLNGVFFEELLTEVKIKKVVAGVIQLEDLDHALVAVNRSRSYAITSRYAFAVSLFVPDVKKGEIYALVVKPSQRLGKDWDIAMGLNATQGQFDNIIYFPSLTIYNI